MRVNIRFTLANLRSVVMTNNPKYTNPAVARLKGEHALLSLEINQLNRELLALKDIIRYKQKDLRKINTALIHKATRGPFLGVVQSTPISEARKLLRAQVEVTLVCLQGGKCSCK